MCVQYIEYWQYVDPGINYPNLQVGSNVRKILSTVGGQTTRTKSRPNILLNHLNIKLAISTNEFNRNDYG